MDRIGDLAQGDAIAHCNGILADKIAGVSSYDLDAQNPAAPARGEDLDLSRLVAIGDRPVESAVGEAVDLERLSARA